MKILFVMRHSGYVRNFESTLRLLCQRGHRVHLAFQNPEPHALLDAGDVAGQLAEQYEQFSRGAIPVRDDSWGMAARDARVARDYLRYLTPEYANAPKLVGRAAREAGDAFVSQTSKGFYATATGRAWLDRTLRARHRAVPTYPRIDAFLEAHSPDVLVLTPLIEPGAPQAEYVRSAGALGIRTALCVASWDNLTNKGLIHGDVGLVTVWNDMMKREAVERHGVPADRVVVTGAQPFDHWFGWQPSTTRAEFCAQTSLPPDRPFILYVCSSRFIAPKESVFVREWIRQLREAAPPRLRDAGILVRPHPQNAEQWATADLTGFESVSVWPARGQAPSEAGSRADYFDSMYHAAAVVGINTTAEIECAIVGRPVFTLLAPEFRDTQEGTLHFEHLRSVNGGLLNIARDFPEHLAQLDAALGGGGIDAQRCRRFVEAFVRPKGVDVAATPILVEALERFAAQPAPAPTKAPLWAPFLRPSLERHGARLLRQTVLDAEARAARATAKRKKRLSETTATVDAPTLADKPIRNWKDLARWYGKLDYQQRVYFGRATLDSLPGELLQSVFDATKPERLDYPGADVYLRIRSKAERTRLRACAKEPFTIEWIEKWVRAGDVLYDIGSNIGVYSLVAAKQPGGGARVFSFDPSYANIAGLGANIVLNGVVDQVTPLPVALSDTTAMAVFALRSMEPGTARHTLGDGPSPEGPPAYRQPVMTFRLDDLVDTVGLPLPHHIKLDVDGGELAVLAGAAAVLGSPSLKTMLIEVSTTMSEAVSDVLAGHGLRLHAKVNVQSSSGEYLVWYGLFTRDGAAGGRTAEAAVGVVTR
jgi:FkbM family methyltransferase